MDLSKIKFDYDQLHNALQAFYDYFPKAMNNRSLANALNFHQKNHDLSEEEQNEWKDKWAVTSDHIIGHLGKEELISKDQAFSEYKITLKGKMYLNMGGFKKQYHSDKNLIENKLRSYRTQYKKDIFIMISGVIGWVLAMIGFLFQSSC